MYPGLYRDAFAALSFQKIAAPLIKLELLRWCPLAVATADFEAQAWFQHLMLYGFRDSDPTDGNDPDIHMVPELVEQVLLPKLSGMLEFVWDPFSTPQTALVLALVKKLFADYATITADREPARNLLSAIVARLKRGAEENVVFPRFSRVAMEANMAAQRLLHARLHAAVKFLKLLISWEEVLRPAALQDLAVGHVLARVGSGLSGVPCTTEVLAILEELVKTVPHKWFSGQSASTIALKMALAPLTAALSGMAAQLKHKSGEDFRARIAALLTHLGESDVAVKVLKGS